MNWHLLYTTSLYTQAAIIQGKLEENQIPVKILNRQDSMYISIGEIELYVPMHLKEIAMAVINETLKN
jgi:Putative prokaryotic signal transducing protein